MSAKEIDLDDLTGATSPLDWGVPHTEWRPNQKDALDNAVDLWSESDSKNRAVGIFELPTGSGKSSIPTALAKIDKVVVFVHSLALLDQYRDKYGFTIVKGMAEYECVNESVRKPFLEKHKREPRVSECPLDDMATCPVASKCLYLVAREEALASRRMACTYPFALLSFKVGLRHGIAVFDEAHSSVEAIIQLSTITYDGRWTAEWGLSSFPFTGVQAAFNKFTRGKVIDWLYSSIKDIQSNRPNDVFIEDVAMWKAAVKKLSYGLAALETNEPYYVESGSKEHVQTFFGRRIARQVPYLLFRPFSASVLSWKLTKGKEMTILMSATIGDPKPLANELGIKRFFHKDYPHPAPVESRPVYDLKFERMTYDRIDKYPKLFKLQARRISDFIRELPADWRGLILCSSYAKCKRIKEELMPLLGSRVFLPPEGVKRVDYFLTQEKDRKGLIVIDVIQVWGQGLDLWGDLARFMIIESVPFGNLTDPFEKERKKLYSSDYAWWLAYMTVPQACGRVSRGELNPDGSWMLNVAALADGSATTQKGMGYYPNWFRSAIVPWRRI